jgi:hypothetical protein
LIKVEGNLRAPEENNNAGGMEIELQRLLARHIGLKVTHRGYIFFARRRLKELLRIYIDHLKKSKR